MSKPKLGTSKHRKPMHYSVGAIIKQDDKYLIIDRVKEPLGFACLAGHIDEGETEIIALKREVPEESGYTIISYKLIDEEELDWNTCHRGIDIHYWYVYEVQVKGEIKQNIKESKSIDWYTIEQIKELNKQDKLEPVWKYWFEKLKII